MSSDPLENLASIGKLHAAKHSKRELQALRKKSLSMLDDARQQTLSLAGRFTLVYGAAHGLALAALWKSGYRSDNRVVVFECLIHTAQPALPARKALINAHKLRNQMEYEADESIDEAFVEVLIAATQELARATAG